MAIVNQVEKKVRMDHWDIIKFQILTYCYLNHIPVSDADLDLLTLLAISGEQELSTFCEKAAARKIFKSSQTVRNAVGKAEQKLLVRKEEKKKSKKKISLSPEIQVLTEGNILLDYKFLSVAA